MLVPNDPWHPHLAHLNLPGGDTCRSSIGDQWSAKRSFWSNLTVLFDWCNSMGDAPRVLYHLIVIYLVDITWVLSVTILSVGLHLAFSCQNVPKVVFRLTLQMSYNESIFVTSLVYFSVHVLKRLESFLRSQSTKFGIWAALEPPHPSQACQKCSQICQKITHPCTG